MTTTNPYCEALGIQTPSLEVAKTSPDANYYSLLIVALLERGKPVTLPEAARCFEEAGVATADRALASFKRCKPGRPPIYRDGDLYALDPHNAEAALWAFRLGLRPPKAPALRVVRPDPGPLPFVVGSAPGWAVPWARAQRAYVEKEEQGWRTWLVDEQGDAIDEDEVQLARLAERG